MTANIRLWRLWRTSALLCALGAAEFGYVTYLRRSGWFLLPTLGLAVAAGWAWRRAVAARQREG
jgi:hypothetical protein